MFKTTFHISQMDCPSEEQLIRLKLEDSKDIQSLFFDIPNRNLDVYHVGNHEPILFDLDSLKLGTRFVSTGVADKLPFDKSKAIEKTVLIQALLINLFFFVLEAISGFLSNSMGLVADSMDMFADAVVLGLSLYALHGSVSKKKSIAKIAGFLQLILVIVGVLEVARRFIGISEVPVFQTMAIISALALIGNAASLYLLQKAKSKDAHIKASVIFLSNDVIINFGIIMAGGLVFLTNSKYPDLVISAIVYTLVGYGAFRIFRLSK